MITWLPHLQGRTYGGNYGDGCVSMMRLVNRSARLKALANCLGIILKFRFSNSRSGVGSEQLPVYKHQVAAIVLMLGSPGSHYIRC